MMLPSSFITFMYAKEKDFSAFSRAAEGREGGEGCEEGRDVRKGGERDVRRGGEGRGERCEEGRGEGGAYTTYIHPWPSV